MVLTDPELVSRRPLLVEGWLAEAAFLMLVALTVTGAIAGKGLVCMGGVTLALAVFAHARNR